MNQPDRHLERCLHVDAKVIGGGTKILGGLRRAGGPLSLAILLRLLGPQMGNREQMDFWTVGLGQVFLGVLAGADAHLHVRLARADPDFAKENVRDRNPVFGRGVLNHDLVGPASRLGRQLGSPAAVATGLHAHGRGIELDDHFFVGLGRAPDRVFDAPLQDHVVGKNHRQPNLRPRGGGETGQTQHRGQHDRRETIRGCMTRGCITRRWTIHDARFSEVRVGSQAFFERGC